MIPRFGRGPGPRQSSGFSRAKSLRTVRRLLPTLELEDLDRLASDPFRIGGRDGVRQDVLVVGPVDPHRLRRVLPSSDRLSLDRPASVSEYPDRSSLGFVIADGPLELEARGEESVTSDRQSEGGSADG